MSNPTLPTLRELMAAGAHFGHKRERSHPKAQQFIYLLREGIYIIDLQKTQEGLEKAMAVVSDLVKNGKTVLFVGTKPQASDLVKAAAEACGMPYITNHWPGGLLTNFETVGANLKQLDILEGKLASDELANLTKKERQVMGEKIRKSNAVLGGVRSLNGLPDALFVVDVVAEATAVEEAHRLGVPVIGVTDTNANPEKIDYPIPANDDARKTIELIVGLISQAIAGNKVVEAVEKPAEEKPAEPKVEIEEKPVEEKPKVKRTRTKKAEKVEKTEEKDGN